ncbi:hypothetical protein DYB25_002926 [Aphanomyces astaci]|uniref:Uncharacterized protein n=1 Tax=Aphanomyces astaci TaxID=112090 RepID=A0A397BGE8_APHAT|nr:hypothetical protein DYB25_002926 [Aphanomyces astaci]RHY66114.1 hypothetical protein DYB30_002597 [Aphanomyces astaci]RHY66961.1 hypothetical protein DYB34_008518 [Aphanomyces astaci]
MLMYVRSIKASPPVAEAAIDPKKGRVKKFFKSLSFRKPKNAEDDDDTRWSDVFRSDGRKRGDSFFRRLSFLQPRDSESMSTFDRPSFLDHIVREKVSVSPTGTDATSSSSDTLSDLSPAHAARRSPPLRRNTAAAAVDSNAQHTMTVRRIGIPAHPSQPQVQPRRHSDLASYHAPTSRQADNQLVAVQEEAESASSMGDAKDAALLGDVTVIAAEGSTLMEIEDVNVVEDSQDIMDKSTMVEALNTLEMTIEDVNTQEETIATTREVEAAAVVGHEAVAMPLAVVRLPVIKVIRPQPAPTLLSYQVDDHNSSWFDETFATMRATNF